MLFNTAFLSLDKPRSLIQNTPAIKKSQKNTQFKIKFRKPIQYYIGNALIVASVLLLAYIYFPLVRIYFFPPPLQNLAHVKGYFIQIPKIHAQASILVNIDPFNEEEYKSALLSGVAQARGSQQPETNGVVYLFAHSSDVPWRITQYNTAFFRLGELNKGDEIYLYKNGKKYRYMVTGRREVWPNEVSALEDTIQNKNTSKHQIILQTCTPIGTSLKRLLIFGEES